VQSDKPGLLDNASSFGRTLSPQLIKQQENAKNALQQGNVPSQSVTPQMLNGQWPQLSTPSSQRLVKRPPAQGLEREDGSPVFTPDFSRQRLTLAGLVNRSLIDLPNQEVANLNTDAPLPKPVVNAQTAYNLYDLVGVGLSYSPVMDQTRAQLDVALSRAKQARADLLPRAGVRYAQGPEWSQAVGATNKHETTTLGVRLTQPIVNIPLIRDWMSELKGQQSASWRLQASRESVSLAVTSAVASLAAARVVLEFSDEQLSQFNELLQYVQSRAQSGVSSTADLERTRSRVLLARQIRIEQQAAYRNALLELERLTGQTPEALELPYLNQLPGLPATQAQLRRLVWDHSYDLRALRSDIEAQTHTVSSQYSKLLPTLDLSVERDEATNVRAIAAKQTDSRVMAVLTWGASLGGKEIYAGRSAASELSNRQAKLTEEGEKLMQAVDADFALLQSATLRVSTGEAEQKATAAVVASVQEQLKTGRMSSLLEALDAFERHFAARQRLAQTLTQQIQAQAQLLRRLGMLSHLNDKATMQLEPAPEKPAVMAPLAKASVLPEPSKSALPSSSKQP
jgi:adhesin transport system outer membrane protein